MDKLPELTDEVSGRRPAVRRSPRRWPGRLTVVVGIALAFGLAVVPVQTARADTPLPATSPSVDTIPGAEAVIAAARSYLGVPYRVGSEGPYLFDCSGLVFRAFSDAGELALIGGSRLRAAGYQRWFAAHGLLTTDAEEAQRGDLVIYAYGEHIGIYLGDGRVISALTSGVTTHAINGITLAPTSFLAVDWSSDRGPYPPGDETSVPIVDEPEAPAALVPPVAWVPAPSAEVVAAPASLGVERTDMRTAYSRTFEDGVDQFTTELFTRPIFYQPDGSADWQPIDLRFQPLDADAGSAVAETSPATLTVSSADADGGFLSLSAGERLLQLGLPATSATRVAAVPLLVDDGRFADYHDLIAGGIGLRVLPRADGFKAFLVFAERPDVNRFSFVFGAPDTSLAAEVDGTLTLRDVAGSVVGRIPRPLLLDSSDVDGDGGGLFTAAVSLGLETVEAQTLINLKIDHAFLDEAVYPAYVDLAVVDFPTGSTAATHTFASSDHPNHNFSTYQRPEMPGYSELWQGRQPDTRNDNEAYLRFAELSQALSGVSIESASLRSYPYWQYDHEGAPSTWLMRVAEDWQAGTLTWNTRPAAVDLGEFGTTQGAMSEFDVTGYVHDVTAGVLPDYGLMLHATGAGRANWKRLVAESGLAGGALEPRLVVVWSGLRPLAAAQASIATSGVTLRWSDPGVAPTPAARYRVQVSADGFESLVAKSGVIRDDAAAEMAWTVPADALSAGSTYSWRVRAKYVEGGAWSAWSDPVTFIYGASTPRPGWPFLRDLSEF